MRSALADKWLPGPKRAPDPGQQQNEAHIALGNLVLVSRFEGKSLGDTCRTIAAEMRAVHPEWNRAGRRAFVAGFRRKGHK